MLVLSYGLIFCWHKSESHFLKNAAFFFESLEKHIRWVLCQQYVQGLTKNGPFPDKFTPFKIIFWQFSNFSLSLCTPISHQTNFFFLVLSKISKNACENGLKGVHIMVRGPFFCYTLYKIYLINFQH